MARSIPDEAFNEDYYVDRIPKLSAREFLQLIHGTDASPSSITFRADVYMMLAVHYVLCMAICRMIQLRKPQIPEQKIFGNRAFENAVTSIAVALGMKTCWEASVLGSRTGKYIFNTYKKALDRAYYGDERPVCTYALGSHSLLSQALAQVCIDLNMDEILAIIHGRKY
ncbi:hypothetical protein F5Y16DRAFT_399085 [Xylariaceae sp. FL0255]|nr:hypothetical protein F5Y16DRAFT_399085 [Xylariaceae sp. FL0255]